jgi:gliding motility-associated-like protein
MHSAQKIVAIIAFLHLLLNPAHATHNRAGEITYKHISGYTFEFTVSTYTYALSQVERDFLIVSWGDGTSQEIARDNRIPLPNDYLFNTYVSQHTFPGPGTYQILMEDPNRNLGVNNIPNSVNTIFSIQTTMLIGPFIGNNTTPLLLNPPIDKAAKNHIFIHNPGAYDADGDSISFQLTTCTAENGMPIEGYTLPPASDTLYIDSYTGDLTWITPTQTGIYNIAIFIDEWRNGVKIGRLTRDMQIDVYDTDNNPPVNGVVDNYCIEAGDTVEFFITTTDADNDLIKQYMIGPPISDKSATFEMTEGGMGFMTSKFTWPTNCSYARQQPYTLVLKSEDQVTDVSLVDITSFQIRVLPNAPKNLRASPGTDTIRLEWDVSTCGVPSGYKIYRRIGAFNFTPDSCENGVPSYTGYELLDEVRSSVTNYYTDDNLGKGLVPGFDYCYMVTAIYGDGVESFVSEEVCSTLIPGIPSMLEVSVLNDAIDAGQISVKWVVPQDFDTIDDGPYRYEVYRMSPNETNYSLVNTINTTDLSDTSYIDKNINTLIYPYFYTVKLLYQLDNGDWVLHPGSEIASSLYLNLIGSDNTITVEMKKRAPWLNYAFDVFRKAESAAIFDSIGTSPSNVYIDENLANNTPYTYRAKSHGLRPLNNRNYETVNISHINTTSAVDSFPPCTPKLKVISVCDSSYNLLSWIPPKTLCGDEDVISYLIYYRPTLDGDFQLIETINYPDSSYIHRSNLETLAAVYGIAAVDSFNNVSKIGTVIIDSCLMYSLPNVFSPGGDGINDVFVPWNMGGFIKKVDMTIYNRYGQAVYKTNDPNINWDGYHKESGKLVSTGVYYYICDVYEQRLTGEVRRTLKGFIHVFSGDDNKQIKE